jgi:hypothetical protein
MAITTLTETESNVLFDILVEHAGHSEDAKGYHRAEFFNQFTDPSRYSGEYWFSGKFNDFKLIAETHGLNHYWKLIKQGQPARNSPAAIALEATNEALGNAYATGTLSPPALDYGRIIQATQ